MLYHDLLDCDPQTNSLRYKRVTCRKNYSDRDNGALSSNTRHCAPLERGNSELSYSTDMALLWIEKHVLLAEGIIPIGIMARYRSSEWIAKAIEIPSDSRPSRFGDGISIALIIHSLDPLQTSSAQLRKINRC